MLVTKLSVTDSSIDAKDLTISCTLFTDVVSRTAENFRALCTGLEALGSLFTLVVDIGINSNMTLFSLFSCNVSQTRWIINDERKGEASVEELIGGNTLPICNGDGYKFHPTGREDIDVRMLCSGRPFLIEVQNVRHIPSEVSIKEMEKKINSLESNLLRVNHLKVLDNQVWSLTCERKRKKKQYAALQIKEKMKEAELYELEGQADMKIRALDMVEEFRTQRANKQTRG
nr:putative tRNA pseudouridine synthase Pus10 [Tanacetum cinerariifolium]